MSNSAIELADAFPICITKVFRDEGEDPEWFCVTRVQGGRLSLEAAQVQLDRPPPRTGERIFVESALSDGAYRLRVRVVESEIGEWVTLTCEQDGRIERIQRRVKSRLFANIPVRIERTKDPSSEPLSLVTEDINSHGMRLLSRIEMGLAESVKAVLHLEDGKPALKCRATVVRCRNVKEGLFDIGMRFQGLEKKSQDRLVQVLIKRMFNL